MNDASRNVPRSVAWVALAALTLILAGCGVRYDFVIHDNETADLTYIMWDSSDLHLITKETCTEKDLGKSSPLPEGVEATYTYTSHNSNPACQVTAKAVPLSKLQTDTWTIKHKDGQYIFDLSPGSLSKLGSKNPQLPSQNIGGSTKVAVSVTFPGEVTKSNGRSEGNKVTWDNALESSDSLHAEGEDGSFHLRWWMVAIASGIVLLIIVGVVIYLLRVRRAQQPTPGPTQVYPVADLQAGYSPYVDPSPGAVTFPPQDTGYAGHSTGPGLYGAQDGDGAYAPGPGYAQMPYQEGTGHSDFRPPQERP